MSKSLKKLIDINGLREFKNKLVGPDAAYVQTGVIIPFAGTSVPTGYLLCNGAAVSRTDYANLFAAIGTLYGAGDGSTTFNLPDARDRVLQGASGKHSTGSYIAAGLPNITGAVGSSSAFLTADSSSGAFKTDWGSAFVVGVDTSQARTGGFGFGFDASKSNALYGANSTVQPPAIATNFIIKY